MAIDLNEHLMGQLAAVANESVGMNQRLHEYLLLAFGKDLFQSGQGEVAAILAGLNAADRTPQIK